MAKQKVVMRLSLEDAKKRRKALKTAVELPGVVSVALDKDRIIVVGEGVDSVALTVVLRKKLGCVELVSVGSADEKRDKSASSSSSAVAGSTWPPACWHPAANWPYQAVVTPAYPEAREENCRIM